MVLITNSIINNQIMSITSIKLSAWLVFLVAKEIIVWLGRL